MTAKTHMTEATKIFIGPVKMGTKIVQQRQTCLHFSTALKHFTLIVDEGPCLDRRKGVDHNLIWAYLSWSDIWSGCGCGSRLLLMRHFRPSASLHLGGVARTAVAHTRLVRQLLCSIVHLFPEKGKCNLTQQG